MGLLSPPCHTGFGSRPLNRRHRECRTGRSVAWLGTQGDRRDRRSGPWGGVPESLSGGPRLTTNFSARSHATDRPSPRGCRTHGLRRPSLLPLASNGVGCRFCGGNSPCARTRPGNRDAQIPSSPGKDSDRLIVEQRFACAARRRDAEARIAAVPGPLAWARLARRGQAMRPAGVRRTPRQPFLPGRAPTALRAWNPGARVPGWLT